MTLAALLLVLAPQDSWVTYPGPGKHIVLIAGEESYRSEESMPLLARILSKHHGFKCTVLFAVDPKDGTINPMVKDHIPGLEALEAAGFHEVVNVLFGFEGELDEHFQRGRLNGWRHDGLPWEQL